MESFRIRLPRLFFQFSAFSNKVSLDLLQGTKAMGVLTTIEPTTIQKNVTIDAPLIADLLIRPNPGQAIRRRACDLSRPMIASTNSGKRLLEAPSFG